MSLIMLITLIPVTALADGTAWNGTAVIDWYDNDASELTITTAEQLAGLAKLVNEGNTFQGQTIKLGADIDLGGKEWMPIGTKDSPFKGTFDGANDQATYAISNLTIDGTGYLGLFGVTNGATISNLTLSNINITGSSDRVGTLAGQTAGTTITNVTIKTAQVTSTKSGDAYVGGLTGEGYTGTIENCTVDGLILSAKGAFIGGISSQGYAKINDCVVKNSSITSTNWKVGGIIGQLNEGNSTFTGNQVLDSTITNTGLSGSVGGIIGFSNYGTKTLTNNTVRGVILNSRTGAGGLIGSISSKSGNVFRLDGCTVEDLTFRSDDTITSSGGLVGEEYWRMSSGTTVTATGCIISDVKVDAAADSKVGALFGEFASGSNTYKAENVSVTTGTSGTPVSQLVGDPALGSSTFTVTGSSTQLDSVYANEAMDYLEEGTVLTKDEKTGNYGVSNRNDEVAFIKGKTNYYTSLSAAFTDAMSGDVIVMVSNDSSVDGATLNTSVTLEPSSYTLPAITVAESANLTISGSNTLNSDLTNSGTVTVDQNTTVISYTGNGALVTNQTGKRVKWDENEKKLVLYDIPYVFEVNGVKYEDMDTAAAAIGASWDADSSTLTLQKDVSITGTVGILSSITLELNGHQISNTSKSPLISTEENTTFTVQDSSAAQTGRLVTDKNNIFQGYGKIILKSGTVEAESDDIYYALSISEGLDIQGGTVITADGKAIVDSYRASYVNITGGTFNVLPDEESVENGYTVVQIGESYQALPNGKLDSGITHGTVIATQVAGTYYASLKNAIDAAMAGTNKTITLLSNITANSWNMIWNITGITLDGDGHTIKVNDIQSGQNHDAVFHSLGGNTFKDLTVDLSGVTAGSLAQGSRAFSAAPGDSFSNVTVIGSEHVSYGITVGGTDATNETVTIDGCHFENLGYAVYDSESADVENLIIKNSTMTNCDYTTILRSENGQFIGNSVDSGKLNIMTEKQTITGNTFTDGSRIKFYDQPAAFEKNNISADSKLDANTGVAGIDVSENYWGGGAPSSDQLNHVSVTGSNIYYERPTMNPEDLNTYVPPTTGGGSSSSGDYLVNVNKVTGGKITVTPGRADKGDTVTITVKPNDGYELDTLVVTDKNGNTVKLTDKGNGKYTFTMPSSQVTVNASFAKDSSSPVDSFLDVNTGAWYYDAVKYAVESGLMSGTGTYTFEPNTTLSRGMIAQMLYALEGKPSISSANNFTDVSSSDWYDKAASWAQSKGIITGYEDGRFGPNDPLTREQLALILYNYAKSEGYGTSAKADLSKFADGTSTSPWAQQAMSWAVGEGLLSGRGVNMLYPTGTATRAEVAQIMMNFCENVAK